MRSNNGAGIVSSMLAVQTKRTRDRSTGTSMLDNEKLVDYKEGGKNSTH